MEYMQKEVKIFMNTTQYEVEESLFSMTDGEEIFEEQAEHGIEPDVSTIKTFGTLKEEEGRCEIAYDETELTGMEGSRTAISFELSRPDIVTLTREGNVSTAFVFENGKRHHCVYNTPYMPFEVCIKTISVNNDFLETGCIDLDYVVEIRGARAERTKISLSVSL